MNKEPITLWEETVVVLERYGLAWSDVTAIRIAGKRMEKDTFERLSKKIKYKPWAYGAYTIDRKLRIFGRGFVMIRQWDGREWWELIKTQPEETDEVADSRADMLAFALLDSEDE